MTEKKTYKDETGKYKKIPGYEGARRKKNREGNPRSTKIGPPPKTFSDKQCLELGEDLLAWLSDPDGGLLATHFVRWYHIKHKMFRGDFTSLCDRTTFAPYYDVARKILTENIMHNQQVAQSYGNRYLAFYDGELNDFEEKKLDKQMERQIKVKQKEVEATALGIEDFKKSIKDGTFLQEITQKDE